MCVCVCGVVLCSVCVRHVRRRSQVSVMCDDHYCHTPAPLLQLTLPMQMSLIASPRPSLLPNRLDDVHLLDLIKVMREGGRDGRMVVGVEEKGVRWKNREKRMKEIGTRIENKGNGALGSVSQSS